MESKDEQYKLLKALLPEEIFKYFEIIKVVVNLTTIDVHLDELNFPSSEFKDLKLNSKGFHPAVMVQDFPLRERANARWNIDTCSSI